MTEYEFFLFFSEERNNADESAPTWKTRPVPKPVLNRTSTSVQNVVFCEYLFCNSS